MNVTRLNPKIPKSPQFNAPIKMIMNAIQFAIIIFLPPTVSMGKLPLIIHQLLKLLSIVPPPKHIPFSS